MVRGLESHKRHAFLVALPNVSKPMLERKAASLRQHIWLVAMVAFGADPSPVTGVPEVACDLYTHAHPLPGGLPPQLRLGRGRPRQAGRADGPAPAQDPGGATGPKTKITEALVAELLGQASGDASTLSQDPLNVPILGSLAACGLSFATVYRCSAPPWMWTPRACWLRPPSTTPNNAAKDPSPEPGPAGGGSEGLGARRLHLCPGWVALGGGKEETQRQLSWTAPVCSRASVPWVSHSRWHCPHLPYSGEPTHQPALPWEAGGGNGTREG
ncbi:immunity-related GTPase family, cinema [Pontoporia blainvillei]|uniref:Immunity-related GTPase family, cinema n=1 Tax=Pontoporia blainvillei TaxID=48723 RepID=A0ABX0S7P5_PONBL|nr:immunity-related GTPase family, cinema [Pontoporia blainvillei]